MDIQIPWNVSSSIWALLIVILIFYSIKAIHYFAPGPWGIPIYGYYPFLRPDFYNQLHELSKKYGPAYLINLAGQTFLYLDDMKALREAHLSKAECFPARSNKHSIMQYCFDHGLAYLGGEEWRIQRKSFAKSMREVGLSSGRDELLEPIDDVVRLTLKRLQAIPPEESVDLVDLLSKECINAVLRLILGDDVGEEQAQKINEAYLKMVLPMGDINVLLLGNVARYTILPFIRGYSDMFEGKKEMSQLIRAIVDDRKKHFNPSEQPQDLIGAFLRERSIRIQKEDPQAKCFTDDYLVSMLMLAYGDGSVGVGMFVASFLRELSLHRDAQEAVFEEISRVVGGDRLPSWADRQQLPLTASAIKELFRVTKFFPVYPSLECVQDTTVLGVRAPKGCVTLVNNWALHHDPTLYKEPDRFDITRFLPGDEKETDPVPFGLGRRACAGEALVMMEIFALLAGLLQNFLFLPATDGKRMGFKDPSPYEDTMSCQVRVAPRFPKRKNFT